MTKCTIAIPVYNGENFIRDSLPSALQQDAGDMEILVVDNYSTDSTWEILSSFSDDRLRLIRNERNLGLFGNFNRCLELAEGKYLRFLCADDTLTPGCIEEEILIMERYPNIGLLSSSGLLVDENWKTVEHFGHRFPPGIYPGLLAIPAILWFHSHYGYNPINYPSGILFNRQTALDSGRFNPEMKICGDMEFFFGVLERSDLGVIDDIGCNIRVHENQQSQKLDGSSEQIDEVLYIVEKYKAVLSDEGTYSRIKNQYSGLAFGIALGALGKGQKQKAHQYFRLSKSIGKSFLNRLSSLLTIVAFRLLSKLFRVHFAPRKFTTNCIPINDNKPRFGRL